jgi:hypothetical protein
MFKVEFESLKTLICFGTSYLQEYGLGFFNIKGCYSDATLVRADFNDVEPISKLFTSFIQNHSVFIQHR